MINPKTGERVLFPWLLGSETKERQAFEKRVEFVKSLQFIGLSSKQEAALFAAVGLVLEALYNPSESCLNNVINPLAEKFRFGVADFWHYLNQGARFYDGTRSIAPIAGNVTYTQPANAKYGPGASIARDEFNQTRRDPSTGLTLRTEALTSITNPTFTSYLRPSAIDTSGTSAALARNAGLIFHEGLHGFGGILGGVSYFDSDLKDAFKLTGVGSDDISKHISKNCFE
jgi:hypothetical protein